MGVYFISDGERVKIGYTAQSPQKRLAALQTGNPKPLELLAFKPEWGMDKEKELHHQFDSLRATGEWFDAEDDLLAFIDSLSSSCKRTFEDLIKVYFWDIWKSTTKSHLLNWGCPEYTRFDFHYDWTEWVLELEQQIYTKAAALVSFVALQSRRDIRRGAEFIHDGMQWIPPKIEAVRWCDEAGVMFHETESIDWSLSHTNHCLKVLGIIVSEPNLFASIAESILDAICSFDRIHRGDGYRSGYTTAEEIAWCIVHVVFLINWPQELRAIRNKPKLPCKTYVS